MRSCIRGLAAVVLVAVAGSVVTVAQRQFDPPFELPVGVTLERDVVYSRPGGRELKLDVFAPESQVGLAPAIVYVLGSGWNGGDKSHFWRQAAHMATLGFVGVCIEHRGSAEAHYPAAVDDAKTAVRWLRANATRYRVDPERIGAAGGSSGGHIASMLGVTRSMASMSEASEYAGFSADVRAVAAFNPALDLRVVGTTAEGRPLPERFLGVPMDEDPARWAAASPITRVDRNSAAFLILHGTDDVATPYAQATAMVRTLEQAGVSVELLTADGVGHGFFNTPPWYQPTLERMAEFFVRVLGPGAGPAVE